MSSSAAEYLSQEEVDALLRDVTGEAEDAVADDGAADEVRAYNLATQERIVRDRMPTLERIHERFARCLRIGMSSYMHGSVEVAAEPIRVEKYAEFVRRLAVPANLNLVSAKPLQGTALVVFDPDLVFLVVDNLFGGDGRFHTRAEGRDFTHTEQRIIFGMLKVVFAEYAKSWAPVLKLEFEYIRSEMNAQLASIATPAEIVVAAGFTLELGGAQADLHLCFPYAMLEPIRDLLCSPLSGERPRSDRSWIRRLSARLQTAEIELCCNFGTADVRLRDIVELRVGDVIPLDVPELLQAEVDGVPVLEGRQGTSNGRYALRVERFIAPEEGRPVLPGERHG